MIQRYEAHVVCDHACSPACREHVTKRLIDEAMSLAAERVKERLGMIKK